MSWRQELTGAGEGARGMAGAASVIWKSHFWVFIKGNGAVVSRRYCATQPSKGRDSWGA